MSREVADNRSFLFLITTVTSSILAQDNLDVVAMRNDWISPYFILTYYHSKCSGQAQEAINTILNNASDTANQGPWSVVHDGKLSPDGSSRSYVSWAPYYWPACCEDLDQNEVLMEKKASNDDTNDVKLLAQNSVIKGGILPVEVDALMDAK